MTIQHVFLPLAANRGVGYFGYENLGEYLSFPVVPSEEGKAEAAEALADFGILIGVRSLSERGNTHIHVAVFEHATGPDEKWHREGLYGGFVANGVIGDYMTLAAHDLFTLNRGSFGSLLHTMF